MVRLHVLQLAVCAALVAVCDAAKGAKCSAVLCSGVSVSDPDTILNDMGNSAPADLIMKSSYEDWSINELTLLKGGMWPTSGDVCTAGFYLDLLDNSRGRVMKVSQIAADQRVSIMLPALGLEGFTGALARVLREGGELVVDAVSSSAEAPGRPGEGNVELASKLVPIEGKRFFLDLKENEIGRFVQVAEVDQGGRRTKMSLPLSAAGQFRDSIGIFADLDMSALGRQAYTDKEGRPATLRSELLKLDRKQIHFDLTANAKGCVLKVSMRDDRGRTTLMIPSTGLAKLRDAFTTLCG